MFASRKIFLLSIAFRTSHDHRNQLDMKRMQTIIEKYAALSVADHYTIMALGESSRSVLP